MIRRKKNFLSKYSLEMMVRTQYEATSKELKDLLFRAKHTLPPQLADEKLGGDCVRNVEKYSLILS
jgi:hypothetical protein